jgi:hypothetical protein
VFTYRGAKPARHHQSASRPTPVDQGWEDVVEASIEFAMKDALLSSFEESIPVQLPTTGWHRARYCGRGMDAGHELDTSDEGEAAPDRYLVQLWPAPPEPDRVIAQGSETAAYWHQVARGKSS